MGLFGWRYRMDHERFKRYRRFPTYQRTDSIAPKNPFRSVPEIYKDAHLPEPPNSAEQGVYDRRHAHYEAQEEYEEPDHWFEDPPTSKQKPPRNRPPRNRSEEEMQPDLGELGYVPLTQDIRDLLTPVIPEVPRIWGPETREESPEAHRAWLEEQLEATPLPPEEPDPASLGEIMEAVMEQGGSAPESLANAVAGDDGWGGAQQMMEAVSEQGVPQAAEPGMSLAMSEETDTFSAMQAAHDQQMEMSLEERVAQEEVIEQQGMEDAHEDPFEAQQLLYDEMQQMMDPLMMPGPYGPGPGPGFGPLPGPQ